MILKNKIFVDQLVPVCHSFLCDADQSIIVDKNHTVQNAKYGCIWFDKDGINHKPKNDNIVEAM